MVFGLCPAWTEFYILTKTSFELLRGCILQKYGSQGVARLFWTIPNFNHRDSVNTLKIGAVSQHKQSGKVLRKKHISC